MGNLKTSWSPGACKKHLFHAARTQWCHLVAFDAPEGFSQPNSGVSLRDPGMPSQPRQPHSFLRETFFQKRLWGPRTQSLETNIKTFTQKRADLYYSVLFVEDVLLCSDSPVQSMFLIIICWVKEDGAKLKSQLQSELWGWDAVSCGACHTALNLWACLMVCVVGNQSSSEVFNLFYNPFPTKNLLLEHPL